MTVPNNKASPTFAAGLRLIVVPVGLVVAFCTLLVFGLVWFNDEHRLVTRQMTWQCMGTLDTGNGTYPHVESVNLWFVENSYFQEEVSGPSLCADLKSSGQTNVAVIFDTWGNKWVGLHGYYIQTISLGAKQLTIYDNGSGGFRDNTGGYGNFNSEDDKRANPQKYRFPPDTFR